MDIDPNPPPPIFDNEMTQEELDVQEQLRSLECSREPNLVKMSDNTSEDEKQKPSPIKRSRIANDNSLRHQPPASSSTTRLPIASCNSSTSNQATTTFAKTLTNEKTQPSKSIGNLQSVSEPMARPSSTPSHPIRRSPKRDYEQTKSSEDSDDDSFADLCEYQRATPVRRSTRISKETTRFDPSTRANNLASGSVFGNTFGSQRNNRNQFNALKIMMQERNAHTKVEEELEGLRQDIVTGKEEVGEKEELFYRMAHQEDQKEKIRKAALQKYSASLPLFVRKPQMKVLQNAYRKLDSSAGQNIHQLVGLLRELREVDDSADFSIAMIERCVEKMIKESRSQIPPRVFDVLVHLLVYDNTDISPCGTTRDGLLTTLNVLIEHNSLDLRKHGGLLSLTEVLQAYGMDESLISQRGLEKQIEPEENSLDKRIPTTQAQDPCREYSIARRNLERAFLIASAQMTHGIPAAKVLGISDVSVDGRLATLQFCARILLSPFGSRLYRGIGGMISSTLAQVKREDWPKFRFEAAKLMISHTTCLGVQFELAQFLLPHHTKRGRSLALDIAYLAMCQWHKGPGKDPIAADISSVQPSKATTVQSLKYVSYCISDLSRLAQAIPEVSKETDTEWARWIAKVLKIMIADPRILSGQDRNEIVTLHQILQKLRNCAKRMAMDVAVQDMRNSLDATLTTIRTVCGKTRSDGMDLIPSLLQEKEQTSLKDFVKKS